jgi:ABC-2 type transport system permease protein
MKKYVSLLWAFFRASFSADIEYRLNFGVRIVTDVLYYIAQVAIFEVLFQQTSLLGGWTIHHARVFLGVLFVVDSLWMIIFSENLDRFSDKVRRGDLDLLLAKPVSSQFIMSCQKISTAFIGNFLVASTWLIWALLSLPGGVPWLRLLWLIILIPCGVLIMYANKFLFAITAIILTRAENLQHLWYQVHKLGTRPDAMYPLWLRYIILSVLPVGLVASVPARAILEAANYRLILWTLGMTVFCLYGTTKIWKFALKHYSSASS